MQQTILGAPAISPTSVGPRHASTTRVWLVASVMLAMTAGITGCRNSPSSEPPIHLNPNMDNQAYLEAQEAAEITIDGRSVLAHGRAMQPPVVGTIAATEAGLNRDSVYFHGKAGGRYAQELPARLGLDERLLRRGQERFGIYCVPCHGQSGAGNGIVVQRGFIPPPSYHDQQRRAYPIGKLFEIASRGGEKMPSFAAQIPPEDRWAIVAYVRALQNSHNVTLSEIPADVAQSKGWKP